MMWIVKRQQYSSWKDKPLFLTDGSTHDTRVECSPLLHTHEFMKTIECDVKIWLWNLLTFDGRRNDRKEYFTPFDLMLVPFSLWAKHICETDPEMWACGGGKTTQRNQKHDCLTQRCRQGSAGDLAEDPVAGDSVLSLGMTPDRKVSRSNKYSVLYSCFQVLLFPFFFRSGDAAVTNCKSLLSLTSWRVIAINETGVKKILVFRRVSHVKPRDREEMGEKWEGVFW